MSRLTKQLNYNVVTVQSSVLISAAPASAGVLPLPDVTQVPLGTPDVASFGVLSCSAAWIHIQPSFKTDIEKYRRIRYFKNTQPVLSQ